MCFFFLGCGVMYQELFGIIFFNVFGGVIKQCQWWIMVVYGEKINFNIILFIIIDIFDVCLNSFLEICDGYFKKLFLIGEIKN